MWTIDSNLLQKPQRREMDLTVLLDKFIVDTRPSGSGFPLIGGICVDLWCYWGINPIYILAHAIHETGFGKSSIFHDKNNLFGYRAYDKDPEKNAGYFDSEFGCIAVVMRVILQLYLRQDGTYFHGASLRGMNEHYASDKNEPGDPLSWADKICLWMNKIQSFVDEKRKPKGGEIDDKK